MKFWQIFQMGGITMYVLVLFSIVSLAVIIERLLYFKRKSRVKRGGFIRDVKEALQEGDQSKAFSLSRKTDTPFAHVVAAGLEAAQGNANERIISNAMERQIALETVQLERFTGIAGTIGSTAVYVGLLGTVIGIMRAFHDISTSGAGGINIVIGGISEALACTAAGLCVAVPAVIAYNYFVKRIDIFIVDMELCASEVLDVLTPKKK